MLTDIRNLIGRRRSGKNDEGGFTLIELLIVVVVLGILSGIVVFAVQNLTKDSAAAACRSDARSVESAQEVHKAKDIAYAANVGALVTARYLKSVPAGGARYSITTDNTGVVTVTAPTATGTPTNFRATGVGADPCKNAG